MKHRSREPSAETTGGGGAWLAISGGVGGSKLARGLARALGPEALTVVANTGDDFEHLGLHICPDLDTLTYALAGLANPATGWGRAGETWTFMRVLAELGGETWFRLGDGDLALHVERTRRLRAGEPLSAVAADVCERLRTRARVLPMSDDPVRTVIETDAGALAFQHYFVRERCEPRVRAIRYEGAARARPHPALIEAPGDPALAATIICPSNPFLSIGPVLALPGVRRALEQARAPVIAVSPVVGGRALRGPTAKIMHELGLEVTAVTVARHYAGIASHFVIDRVDEAEASRIEALGLRVLVTDTVMKTPADETALAAHVAAFAGAPERAAASPGREPRPEAGQRA